MPVLFEKHRHYFSLPFQEALWLTLVCILAGSFWGKTSALHFWQETSSFLLILFILTSKAHKPAITAYTNYFILTSIGLLALYLLPLPIGRWLQLSGRNGYQDIILLLEQTGNAITWHSLSLNAHATAQVLLALLPPLAAFLGTTCLTKRQIYRLIWFLLACAILQASWGMAQYAKTGIAQGSFANYNHYAALMGLALPLALGLLTQHLTFSLQKKQIAKLAGYGLIAGFIFLGGILSTSRAGTAGLIFGLTASILVFGARFGLKHLLTGFGVLSLLALAPISLGMVSLPARFTALNPWEDPRWVMFSHAIKGIKTFFPLGSGPGTFADAYTAFQPLGWVGGTFVSHAHNDYLELLFETGVVGAGIIAGFTMLFLHGLRLLWRQRQDGLFYLKTGAAISIMTALLHAFFDFNFHVEPYPVFFAAISGLFFTQTTHKVITVTSFCR